MTIDLNLGVEEQQIVDSVRGLLADRFPVARLRENSATGPMGGELVNALAALGGFDLWRSEAEGGAGMSIVEEMLIHVELGRFLATPSTLACAIAARLAAECGLYDILGTIAGGDAKVCLANAVRPVTPENADGAEIMLFDWQDCDHAVLWNGEAVLLLNPRKMRISDATATDRSVTLGRTTIEAPALIAMAKPGSRLATMARLLVSAQFLGIAQAARDMAADYAEIRTQFGVPIGSFQAIKHRCADMAIRAEAIEAQLTFAAIAERDGWTDADFQNEACGLIAARYALDNAEANIQVHGGIGFSSEADAHLYVLRARLLKTVGGVQRPGRAFLDRRSFAS